MTKQEFFFNTPIYTPIEIDTKIIQDILNSKEEFDGYNPWKKVESTFVVDSDTYLLFF